MVKTVFGLMGSSVANGAKSLSTTEAVNAFLDICSSFGVRELDTARVYNGGQSEELLGQVDSCSRFAVSTKAPGFSPGSLSPEKIKAASDASMKALRAEKIDIYYIHGPDRTVSLEGACQAMDEVYRQGRFERFGVSNLSVDEVRNVYDICKRKGYVLPSVYQGAYNPLFRTYESTLFPLLRELGISFYAFSPLAGGMLAKPIEQILKPHADSRYAQMPIFGTMFIKDEILKALAVLVEACKKEGIQTKEATIRWFAHHAPMTDEDGVIYGASSLEQLKSNLEETQKGPLPAHLVEAFEVLWTEVEPSAHHMG
jgi:aflatoxin B1 aldehyde reductase